MNPDYILYTAIISVVILGFILTTMDHYSASEGTRVFAAIAAIVFLFSFILGISAPLRETITVPTMVHVTKAEDMVVIQAVVNGQAVVENNTTAAIYNNIGNPGYELVYRTVSTPFYIREKAGFILRKKP